MTTHFLSAYIQMEFGLFSKFMTKSYRSLKRKSNSLLKKKIQVLRKNFFIVILKSLAQKIDRFASVCFQRVNKFCVRSLFFRLITHFWTGVLRFFRQDALVLIISFVCFSYLGIYFLFI